MGGGTLGRLKHSFWEPSFLSSSHLVLEGCIISKLQPRLSRALHSKITAGPTESKNPRLFECSAALRINCAAAPLNEFPDFLAKSKAPSLAFFFANFGCMAQKYPVRFFCSDFFVLSIEFWKLQLRRPRLQRLKTKLHETLAQKSIDVSKKT